MTSASATGSKSLFRTILWAGLLVGTLDISAATVNYLIGGGKNAINILIYIASGVFGKEAFAVGQQMAVWGLLFHYLIAYSFTTFFFLIYPRIAILSKSRVMTGIVYGLFIWLIMNRVVLPLANTPKGPFNLTNAVINAGILIVMIGLPLSFIAHRYFRRT